MDGDGEREPHVHARRVELDLGVDELLDAGEVDDVVEVPVGLLARQAEDRGVEVDVLPAGEVGVEAGAELEQRGEPTATVDGARGGLDDAADDLEQRALARAVVPDQSDGRAGRDRRGRRRAAPRSPPMWPLRPAEVDDALLERLVLVDGEALRDVLDADDAGGVVMCSQLLGEVALEAREHPLADPEEHERDGREGHDEPRGHVRPGRAGPLRPPTCPSGMPSTARVIGLAR